MERKESSQAPESRDSTLERQSASTATASVAALPWTDIYGCKLHCLPRQTDAYTVVIYMIDLPYITIIPWACIVCEMVDTCSQRGTISTKWELGKVNEVISDFLTW